jgi:hypothetical protein
MAINPQKVLLIYNTNSDSRIQALNTQGGVNLRDWYAQARGLTTGNGPTDYYYLGFDFGTASYVTMGGYTVSGVTSIDGSTATACTDCSPKLPPSFVGQTLPQVFSYLNVNLQIELVLVMPGVPKRIQNGTSSYNNGQYIELYLAGGLGKNYGFPFGYLPVSPILATAGCMGICSVDATITGTNGITRPAAPKSLTSICILSPGSPTYFGRIGWVLSDGSSTDSNYAYAWGCSSFAQTQTIVTNAITAEQVDNFSKLHVLGGTAYVAGGGGFAQGGVLSGVQTNHLANSAGITNLTYIDGFMGSGYSEASWWVGYPDPVCPNGTRPLWWGGATAAQVFKSNYPPAKSLSMNPAYTFGDPGDQYITGANGSAIQPFVLMSPRIAPKLSDSRCSVLSFAPGGIAYAWMSAAAYLQEFCLRTGGSLAFGCGGEPGGDSVQDTDTILYWLLNGFTGAEASYKAGSSWAYTGAVAGWEYQLDSQGNLIIDHVHNESFPGTSYSFNNGQHSFRISPHGDPLYAPYKAHNLQPRLMQVG